MIILFKICLLTVIFTLARTLIIRLLSINHTNKLIVSSLSPYKEKYPVIKQCLDSFFNNKVLDLLKAINDDITLADIEVTRKADIELTRKADIELTRKADIELTRKADIELTQKADIELTRENDFTLTLLQLLDLLVDNLKNSGTLPVSRCQQLLNEIKGKRIKFQEEQQEKQFAELQNKSIGDTTVRNIVEMRTFFTDQQNKDSSFMLLSGAAATGKTFFLSSVAKILGYSIVEFNNSDENDYFINRKAGRVYQLFETACNSQRPTVLFFKGIEVLMKRKGRAPHDSTHDTQSSEVCDAFVSGLKKIKDHKNIVVVGMTTQKSEIDSEVLQKTNVKIIEFHLPKLAEREQMFKNYFSKINILKKDEIIIKIAKATDGWGYKALMDYAQQVCNSYDANNSLINDSNCTNFYEAWFIQPFEEIDKKVVLQYELGEYLHPRILKLNDEINYGVLVAMAPEIKKQLTKMCAFIRSPEEYRERMKGFNFSPNLLLTGPGGTGKTEFARVVASNANVPFIYINPNDFSQHESMEKLSKIFKVAKTFEKVVIFIDEADVMYHLNFPAAARNMIKTEIDGFNKLKNGSIFTVILATNYPARLDEPDKTRFTEVKFELPTLEQREVAIKALINKMSNVKFVYNGNDCDSQQQCVRIAALSQGFSFREIKQVIENWLLSAVHVAIGNNTNTVLDVSDLINDIQSKNTKHNIRPVQAFSPGFANHRSAAARTSLISDANTPDLSKSNGFLQALLSNKGAAAAMKTGM